jgi:hypothetical protein
VGVVAGSLILKTYVNVPLSVPSSQIIILNLKDMVTSALLKTGTLQNTTLSR